MNRRHELLRHNNVKRLVCITSAGQRLRTAEPVAALLMGIQTGVRNGRLYEAGNTYVKRRRNQFLVIGSNQPLNQIHYSGNQNSNYKKQQNDPTDYNYLKFSIAFLIRRG